MALPKQVIIAKYNENISWFPECPIPLLVYNKSTTPYGDAQQLPNVGREAHTYVYHIIECYDNLANETIFFQGWPFIHLGTEMDHNHSIIWNRMLQPLPGYTPLGIPRIHQEHKHWEVLHVDRMYWIIFGCSPPPLYKYCHGACFAVSKDHILQHSRHFYLALLHVLLDFPRGPWVIERLWGYIFRDKNSHNPHPW